MKFDFTNSLKINKNILLLLVAIFGSILRIYNLGAHNLWYDEVYSLKIATDLNIFRITSSAVKAPLYFVMLHFWSFCFGQSEFAIRSLSMIFGVFSILLIYRVGESFFDRQTGLAGAFILAISPLHIWYSQEARDYIVATFFVLLSVYFFFLIFRKDRPYLWIGFIISSIISLYMNYSSFFIILAGSLILLYKTYRFLLRRWIVTCCIICVGFLPWLPIFLKHIHFVHEYCWIPKPSLKSIMFTFENFNIGYSGTVGIYIVSSMVFFTLFVMGMSRWKEKKDELVFLLLFLVIPILVTFLISQIVPIYLDRQLMLFSPFYYLIVASSLSRIKMCLSKIAVSVSIIFFIIPVLHNYFSYYLPLPSSHHIGVHTKKPLNTIADYMNHNFEDGDAIFFSTISIINITYYISRDRMSLFLIISNLEKPFYKILMVEGVISHMPRKNYRVEAVTLEKEISRIPEVKEVLEKHRIKRVWLVSSSWERNSNLSPGSKVARAWFDNHYSILKSKEFNGVFIKLYVQKTD